MTYDEYNNLLRDIIERRWCSKGEPPNIIYANVGFKHAYIYSIPSYMMTPCPSPELDCNEFIFAGVLVRCNLSTKLTTLICE